MPILSAVEVKRSTPERVLFSQLSCAIEPGDRVGLVGRNGSGKSSLLRVLVGEDAPEEGEVVRAKGVRLGYLAQEPRFEAGHTAVQAVLAGNKAWVKAMADHKALSERMSLPDADLESLLGQQAKLGEEIEQLGGWEREHQARSCLSHFGIVDADQNVERMSGGEKRRVALARLLVAQPEIAVLDEPTNHLDLPAIEGLESWIQDRYRGAVLMVTHDRELLSNLCTHTWEVDEGKLYRYEGGWHAYLSGKAERLAQAAREDANRRNFLRKELAWLARRPKARSTKQKARVARAHEAMEVTPLQDKGKATIKVAEHRSGKMLLEADKISVERGGKTLVYDLTLRCQPGQRIGIVGPNGCGKSSLLKTLLGHEAPSKGEIRLGKHLKVAYLDQMRQTLDLDKSVHANVAKGRTQIELGQEMLTVRSYLERFLIDSSMQRRLASTLSGGERARVALARVLSEDTNLVVLDEPTNDLDVDTLTALESCMMDYSGCLLLVTHDRFLLDRVASHLLVFEPENPALVLHSGNYADWLAREKPSGAAKQATEQKSSKDETKPAPKAKEDAAQARLKKLTYGERLELEALPAKLEAIDEQVAALEQALLDQAFYQQSLQEQRAHQDALAKAQDEQAQLYARWELLETRSEAHA